VRVRGTVKFKGRLSAVGRRANLRIEQATMLTAREA
jgi:hypothetical protein